MVHPNPCALRCSACPWACSPRYACPPLLLRYRRAVLHNLRYDETLAQFANASGVGTNADLFLTGSAAQAARLAAAGACTAISFRTGESYSRSSL